MLFSGSALGFLTNKLIRTCTLKDATLCVFSMIPIETQQWLRSTGIIKNIANCGTVTLAVGLFIVQPSLALRYCALSNKITSYQYGASHRHFIEVFTTNTTSTTLRPNNCLVFVHGGAWGSGKVWHYRLVAEGLARVFGSGAVVLVGYPVYPYSNILHQGDCVRDALTFISSDSRVQSVLRSAEADSQLILAGHSSGANICALALLSQHDEETSPRRVLPPIAVFFGLAGVYDIAKHYLFEAARGVHHISPMAGAAVNEESFPLCSPTLVTRQLVAKQSDSQQRKDCAPESVVVTTVPAPHRTHFVLVHGTEDSTVPHTSSEEFAAALKEFGLPVHTEFMPVSAFVCL